MFNIKEDNISKLSFLSSITIITFMTISIVAFFFIRTLNKYNENIEEIKKHYIETTKLNIKFTLREEIKKIEQTKRKLEEDLKKDLKQRVDQAHDVALNIYMKYHKTKSKKEILALIREAIRPIKYNNGRSYFFINDLKGNNILHGMRPALEGTNTYNLKDNRGKYFVQDFIKIATSVGEGFSIYFWYKPGSKGNKEYKKLSYIRKFDHCNFYIGTGEYFDDVEENKKKTVLKKINNETNLLDYTFIFRLEDINGGDKFATLIANPNRPDLVGKYLPEDMKGGNGKLFLKEMLRKLRKTNSAFVEYDFKVPGTNKTAPKLSYFEYYPEWNWIISKGVYLARFDKIKSRKEAEYKNELFQGIIYSIIFLLIAIISSILASSFFSKKINSIFTNYKNEVESEKIKLKESQNSLEIKVKDRTKDLNDANTKLKAHVIEVEKINKEKDTIQTKLIQSAKLASLGTLASGVAHELNNPLTGILGFANIIIKKEKINSKVQSHLQTIIKSAERMKAIIDHLRIFSRDSYERDWKLLSINEPISNSLILLKQQLTTANIEIKLDFKNDNLIIWGNNNQLESVIQNLLVNSKDAFNEQDKLKNENIEKLITIETIKKNSKVIVIYRDNAGGIAEEALEHIFDPFFTTKEVGEGTGLGMSVSHGIIKEHNGKIEINSQVEKGTTFTITFPEDARDILDEPAKDNTTQNVEFNSNKKYKIFVVDDEEIIGDILIGFLADKFEIIVEQDSDQAIKRLKYGEKFDLVLTDLKMPKFSGIDIIKAVQYYSKTTPTILMSGHARKEVEVTEALNAGAKDFISKPFKNANSILEILKKYLNF